jgi:hypothetical protein
MSVASTQPTLGSSASAEHSPAMMSRSTVGMRAPLHFETAHRQQAESAAATTNATTVVMFYLRLEGSMLGIGESAGEGKRASWP